MIILELYMKDFMLHKKTEVHFQKGVVAIVGENGTGKSSILEAIGIAVFDSYSGSLKERIRNGTSGSQIQVTVRSPQGREFYITRSWGDSSSCIMEEYGLTAETTVYEGHQKVYNRLREEFGHNYQDFFSKLNLIESDSISGPFNLPRSTRISYFEQLLGLEDYEKAWEFLRKPINTLGDRYQQADLELQKLQVRTSKQDELKSDIEAINDVLIDLYTQRDRLQTLLREAEDNEELFSKQNSLREAKSDLSTELSSLAKSLNKRQNTIRWLKEKLERKLDNLQVASQRQCPTCKQRLEGSIIEKTRKDLEKEIETIKDTIDQKREGADYLKDKLERKTAALNRINHALFSVSEELETVKVPEPEKIKTEKEKLLTEIIRLSGKQEALQDMVDTSEEDLFTANELIVQIDNYTSAIAYLEKVRNTFRNLGVVMAAKIRKKIGNDASRWFSQISNKQSLISWEEDYSYSVQLNSANGEISPNRLSGGEKVLSALAIRISLCTLYSKLGFIMLDEPTINLDQERKEEFARVLKESEKFEQIFVVSHDSVFQELMDLHCEVILNSDHSLVKWRGRDGRTL